MYTQCIICFEDINIYSKVLPVILCNNLECYNGICHNCIKLLPNSILHKYNRYFICSCKCFIKLLDNRGIFNITNNVYKSHIDRQYETINFVKNISKIHN